MTGVTEACFAVGCTSLGTFSTRFTEMVGETPSASARATTRSRAVPSCAAMVLGRQRRPRRKRAGSKKHPSPPRPSFVAMTVSISHMHVLTDDPDAALAFYRDTLGLEVRNEVANDGFRWITLSTTDQPEIEIVLSQPHAGRSREDGDALAAMLAKGDLPGILFRTDNLDATFERVQAAGNAEILQEPVSQPWGVRDAAFRDPAGNVVRISQA